MHLRILIHELSYLQTNCNKLFYNQYLLKEGIKSLIEITLIK